jgi:hypothetical protein
MILYPRPLSIFVPHEEKAAIIEAQTSVYEKNPDRLVFFLLSTDFRVAVFL